MAGALGWRQRGGAWACVVWLALLLPASGSGEACEGRSVRNVSLYEEGLILSNSPGETYAPMRTCEWLLQGTRFFMSILAQYANTVQDD